ncbi:hypothetical protein RclHR1_01870012 [Rhizophagus clarus]|uniref:Uncharacterized protein n=1 Tax=Rhizophagus clarus TaxID=94130 RepID=A0A2Z6QMU8_9GLOM|nr:hypothetical protein RclHR1_01870012 [Rhizophagus clarus]GES83817.1 hypothetical protein RCL_e6204_RclHR1_01870012 [Rhizophagus clarus]
MPGQKLLISITCIRLVFMVRCRFVDRYLTHVTLITIKVTIFINKITLFHIKLCINLICNLLNVIFSDNLIKKKFKFKIKI